MKGFCNKPHSNNAGCKHTQQKLFILAIADRGIVSHAKAFADEHLAHEALAEYLRKYHQYDGPNHIQEIIEWLNQHDEYLSVEIIQQNIFRSDGEVSEDDKPKANCPSCGGEVECHPDQDGSCDWQCSRCTWHQHIPGNESNAQSKRLLGSALPGIGIVDLELLKQQAALLGKVMDNIPLASDERTCLQGLWEFVHRVADYLESNS